MKRKELPIRKQNLVTLTNQRCFTTSLLIAKVFEKEHKEVLRSIRELIQQLNSISGNGWDFALVEYEDAKGQMRPMYEMNRDAFSFLVMGFTGSKALQWKVKFLEAFNLMEQELKKQVVKKTVSERVFEGLTPELMIQNTDVDHQRNNSNQINSANVYNHGGGLTGVRFAQDYNRRNCVAITDRTPGSWRREGRERQLPNWACKSAKEVQRNISLEYACARSLADHLVLRGVDEDIAFDVGRVSTNTMRRLVQAISPESISRLAQHSL